MAIYVGILIANRNMHSNKFQIFHQSKNLGCSFLLIVIYNPTNSLKPRLWNYGLVVKVLRFGFGQAFSFLVLRHSFIRLLYTLRNLERCVFHVLHWNAIICNDVMLCVGSFGIEDSNQSPRNKFSFTHSGLNLNAKRNWPMVDEDLPSTKSEASSDESNF